VGHAVLVAPTAGQDNSSSSVHETDKISFRSLRIDAGMSTAIKLFRRASVFLDLIDQVMPVATKHRYTFVSDEWFEQWLHSDQFTLEKANLIVAAELIDKAHVAALTALL
jgi:hypothetical protein